MKNKLPLPKRPIPALEKTCQNYLQWVRPLLSDEENAKTRSLVKTFQSPGGDGIKLQKELIRWSQEKRLPNWTEPLWYNIYLDSRAPLPINSNVFYLLEKRESFKELSQTCIAAALVLSALQFRRLIQEGKLPEESQGGSPLCMNQYNNLFGTTRIPGKGKDQFFRDPASKHIALLYRGHLHSLPVYTNEGQIISFAQIESSLKALIDLEPAREESQVGILTTMERDNWARVREELLEFDQGNQLAFDIIDSSIFALCLDDISPETPVETSREFLHGEGENRWFDKSLQFIISKNNRIGLNLEHTGFDGSVVTKMVEYIHTNMEAFLQSPSPNKGSIPKKISFVLNQEIKNLILSRKKEFHTFTDNFKIKVLKFTTFGKNRIKTFNLSPDAFVQLAFQMSQYKLFGKCYSSYEAVMARTFLHGRIEVAHCISGESLKFVKAMVTKTDEKDKIVHALREAAEIQSKRLSACTKGEGIDSHLFALLKMYHFKGKQMGMAKVPDIFEDRGYKRLTHSTICTSTTSARGVELAGYGPVVDDGFAIRYFKNPDSLMFHFVSSTENSDQLEKIIVYLKESLEEMAQLMTL